MMDRLLSDYQALTQAAGFVRLDLFGLLQISGEDRARFLHSFCTAEIKNLSPQTVTEAFFLNEKGKTIGHAWVASASTSLLLIHVGRQSTFLINHLDRYLIRDDVKFADLSDNTLQIFVMGPQAATRLQTLSLDLPARNQILSTALGEIPVHVASLDLAGWGYWINCPISDGERLVSELERVGIISASAEALHAIRIRHATPWFGIDFNDTHLPQELNRDQQAISFNKGCYLGQETVARIDAIGHVNQRLTLLEVIGDTPVTVGDTLTFNQKSVGTISSIAWEPTRQRWLALAILRNAAAKTETMVSIGAIQLQVVEPHQVGN